MKGRRAMGKERNGRGWKGREGKRWESKGRKGMEGEGKEKRERGNNVFYLSIPALKER